MLGSTPVGLWQVTQKAMKTFGFTSVEKLGAVPEQVGFCGGMQAMPDGVSLHPAKTDISAQVPKRHLDGARPPAFVTTKPG
jgi:hypothetical protein